MFSMQELIRKGFKVVDGNVCDRCGTYLGLHVLEWGYNCNTYYFDNYDLNGYLIKKEVQSDRWNVVRDGGYAPVCPLRYFGGKNWSSF